MEGRVSKAADLPFGQDPTTLVELVNRVVDRGVVLGGEITISVADVELLYLDLRLLLTAVDRIHRPTETDAPPRELSEPGQDGA